MKLLKETLLKEEHQHESVLSHTCDVRYRLHKANKFAQENLKIAQTGMKTWYDQKARERSFQPGDCVLALLPVHGSPLEARYCGPYTVLEKSNDVSYIISTPERRKSRRLCHINMLKRYHCQSDLEEKPTALTTVIQQEQVVEPDTNGEVMRLSNSEILTNLDEKLKHLSPPEKTQIESLLHEFMAIFPDAPGITTAAVHAVDVGEAVPIKQHPYRVNPVKRDYIRKEMAYMMEHGIVEPSQSPWSSPCVLVPKADGTWRFCTDFRKANNVTKSDCFPLPRIEDCIDRIGSSQFVSKFDLLKGYWQVPLSERAKAIYLLSQRLMACTSIQLCPSECKTHQQPSNE